MGKPRLFKGPAAAHEGPSEIIREFSDARGNGGLLAIRTTDDGGMLVDAYRLGGDVTVRAGSLNDSGTGSPALDQRQILEWLAHRALEDDDDRDTAQELVGKVRKWLTHDPDCLLTWGHQGGCAIPEPSVHKATPATVEQMDAGAGSCQVCGVAVKRVPGGQGPTWIHEESGTVAAPDEEFEVQGNYGHGWEMVTTEATRAEAEQRLREYRDAEPGTPHRIRKVK